MQQRSQIPVFVSVISFLLGMFDLFRGFMHTFLLEYSIKHIAKLDLSTSAAADQIQLLGVFGITNFITGIALILVALRDRTLALIMLFATSISYGVGIILLRHVLDGYPSSGAAWNGKGPMMIYLTVCSLTAVLGFLVALCRKRA